MPSRLIAQGHRDWGREALAGITADPVIYMIVASTIAMSGGFVDAAKLIEMLRRIDVKRQLDEHQTIWSSRANKTAPVLDAVLLTCEVLTARGENAEVITDVLSAFLGWQLRHVEKLHPHNVFELDLVFRAYALHEARDGRSADAATALLARSQPNEDQRKRERDEEHDRAVNELALAMVGLYSTVATALVEQTVDIESLLNAAQKTLEREQWRISRREGGASFRSFASKQVTTLLAAGYKPSSVMRSVRAIHGAWQTSSVMIDSEVVERLSLWPELHEALLHDLSVGAEQTQQRRISANEKCQQLLDYARLMLPLSADDSSACFNRAMDSSNELDREVMSQIGVLDELVTRRGVFVEQGRGIAGKFASVVADAAVRLEGVDHFPWDEAMRTLARLDAPLALASTGRWDVEGKAELWQLLSPVLESTLAYGSANSEQVAALALLVDGLDGVLSEAVTNASRKDSSNLSAVVEEAARVAMADGSRRRKIAAVVAKHDLDGYWGRSLLRQERFVENLANDGQLDSTPDSEPQEQSSGTIVRDDWDPQTLVEGMQLEARIESLLERARGGGEYIDRVALFESARAAVPLKHRLRHLNALAEIRTGFNGQDAFAAIIAAVQEWSRSPAVREWCSDKLAGVILDHFGFAARYAPYDAEDLALALDQTGFENAQQCDLLLRGVERHVEDLGSESLLGIVGMVGSRIEPQEAADLAVWYIERLAARINPDTSDPKARESEIPVEFSAAVGRLLFAYLGDCDLRLRWRAAHAMRSLARTGQVDVLEKLFDAYGRREDMAFRGQYPFYWLAAQLWFVIAWDRIAGETPAVAGRFGPGLLKIALDDTFPHLLLRSFARDACEKLVAAGQFSLTTDEKALLEAVNESPLPRRTSDQTVGQFESSSGRSAEEGRFSFDSTDSLPYWYEPMLRSFSDLDMNTLVKEAERWIVDIWRYDPDRSRSREVEPRGRFSNEGWHLSSHRHGSIPTLEQLHTHLEWHAMWCAGGQMLQSHPLRAHPEDDEWHDTWDDLDHRIRRAKLAGPPRWSADLRGPIPLQRNNWVAPLEKFDEWIALVSEPYFRGEILPDDMPEHLVVHGNTGRSRGTRREDVSVSSALVDPSTGGALLRALQTMEDSWDYRLPPEGDRDEIEFAPLRLIGWLKSSLRDESIDEKDPLRASVLAIRCRPGERITTTCGLRTDDFGQPWWYRGDADEPMFLYESWGGRRADRDYYDGAPRTTGDRLLVRKDELLAFLHGQQLDLVVEVEVTRRERENRRLLGTERDRKREARFARLYRLDSGGGLDVAEGRLGTWTGDS